MKTFVLALIALVLAGIGFGIYAKYRPQPIITQNQNAQAASVSTAQVKEESTDYAIDVEYPQFGIAEIDARIRSSVESMVTSVKEEAKKDRPAAEGFRKYELLGGFDRAYIGDDVVSARITFGQDFGGAHPLPIITTFNFDRKNGQGITLNQALGMIGRTLPQVAVGAKAQLDQKLGSDVIAPEGADPKAENYETFLIEKERVTFIFQPYQVAPYTAGVPEVSFARK
ncbi:DUF3298 domain-containing protein [Candidatus Kaiserbacteria bacterium]|nr:DUF3298 domain-containing protein [Candidatus Kaiserbacteria bacterium]